ncbi:MAG: glycosyltransferase [Bacteroidales bacterium]|nr:glycosyltransferase [Bacteroidales bacterium]
MRTITYNYEGKNAILLINLKATLGGATKRYINLFNYISKENNNYYLIINKELYSKFSNANLLENNKNIIIINLSNTKRTNKPSTSRSNIIGKLKKRRKIKLLSQIKNFLLQFNVWLCFVMRIWAILKDYKFKNIYSIYTGGIWIWPLKYFHDFNLIHSYNDSLLSHTSKNILMFFNSEYWVLKNSDKIDFLSQGIIPRLENKISAIKKEKVFISPNSFIDYNLYFPKYPKEDSVLFLSRMEAGKNPILFFESVKIFRNQFPEFNNIKFYIIGGGFLSLKLRQLVSEEELINVFYEEEVVRPYEYLRSSKVFISIQEMENYPSQSLIEAMACENAIIASDVGETHLLVSDDVGIRVALNAQEIANAIYYLFNNSVLLREQAKSARKKVLNTHNIDNFLKHFYKLFDETL